MANPVYTSQSISGYNSNPPPDDGTTGSDNQLEWAKHKTKLSDPIKTLTEAINTELDSAFGQITFNSHTDITTNHTVTSSDRGKVFRCTNSPTFSLPAAASSANFVFFVFNEGTGTYTLDPNSTELVNGSATITNNVQYTGHVVACDGTDWAAFPFNKIFELENDVTTQITTLQDTDRFLVGDDSASGANTYIEYSDLYADLLGVSGMAATTSQVGFIELLTDAEFATGTDSSRAITASNFTKSIGTNGYIELPGGLYVQWGKYTGGAHNPTVTFPTAFSAIYSVVAVAADWQTSMTDRASSVEVHSAGTTSFGCIQSATRNGNYGSTSLTIDFYWIAFGAV